LIYKEVAEIMVYNISKSILRFIVTHDTIVTRKQFQTISKSYGPDMVLIVFYNGTEEWCRDSGL